MTNLNDLSNSFRSPNRDDRQKYEQDQIIQRINENLNRIKDLETKVESSERQKEFSFKVFVVINTIALAVFAASVTSFFNTIQRIDKLHSRVDNFGDQVNDIHKILKNQSQEFNQVEANNQ